LVEQLDNEGTRMVGMDNKKIWSANRIAAEDYNTITLLSSIDSLRNEFSTLLVDYWITDNDNK
jgi:hypothetical protein